MKNQVLRNEEPKVWNRTGTIPRLRFGNDEVFRDGPNYFSDERVSMTERLEVGELTAANQGEVRALILAGLADHWGSVDESLNPDLDDMVASYGGGRTVVVSDGGEIVGTGTLVPRAEGVAEIVRMSVSSAMRRGGIGRLILAELIEIARDRALDSIILETTSAWTEVVDFYLACGFEVTHTEMSPFGEGTWFKFDL